MSESEVQYGVRRKQKAGRDGAIIQTMSSSPFMAFMPGIATGRRRSGASAIPRGHEPAAAERHPRRVSDLRQEIRQRQDTAAHGGARAFNLAIRACACRNWIIAKRVHPT